jgi:hypothetical protein
MSGIDVGEGSTRVLIYNSLGSPPFSTPAGNAVREDRAGDREDAHESQRALWKRLGKNM